jgi:hypothetical protein
MFYVRNRSWSKYDGVIPFKALTRSDPDLSNLRVFGCPAYVYIDSSQRLKFTPKALQGIFVGYAFDSPTWLVYNPITRKVLRTRGVTFNETWTPSPLSSSGELTSLPDTPSIDSGDPLNSLTAFDNFDDEPFAPPTFAPLPPAIISARQLADDAISSYSSPSH